METNIRRDLFNLRTEYLEWVCNNPSQNNPVMMCIYFTIIHISEELNSTEVSFNPMLIMQLNSIASYNTFKKHFSNLVKNGFVKVIKKSVNQYQSNTITLENIQNGNEKMY